MIATAGNAAGQQTGANHGQEAQGHKEVLTGGPSDRPP